MSPRSASLRPSLVILGAALLSLCLHPPAAAADDPSKWGKAADNKILAQQLVNDLMAQNSDLVVVGLHVTPPGTKIERMIATNLDRVGKEDDDDDIAVFTERKTILCPNAKDPHKFEVQVPLVDVSGKVIGTCGFVFKYNAGDDELELHRRALTLRAWLQKRTPSLEALLTPTAAPLLVDGPIMTLPGSTGKFDFLVIDGARHRLLAAHEKDDSADIFDLNTHQLITRLKLGGIVHVITDPATSRYFASAQGEQTIVALDGDSLKEVGRVKLAGELDALVLVPRHHRVYAAHDNGSHLWAVDTKTLELVGDVAIPGAPEIMTYDDAADRIYLNIKTTDEVVVIDPASNQIVAHWATAPAKSPHGIALDAARGRLYVAGGNGKAVGLDLKTGRVVTETDIAKTVDQAAFDPKMNRLYCAGNSELSVVQVSDEGLRLLGSVPTNSTARNVAVDHATGDVWTTYTDGKDAFAKSWKLP